MLELSKLFFGYNATPIIKGLSLSVSPGKIYGVLGRNGSGKSTLFKLLSGVHKIQSGEIKYNGEALRRDSIGFLETRNFFYPYMKGREYLELLGAQASGISKWNKLFDLPLEMYTDDYSTGMRKKLAFMGQMLLDRPILLLDEPFNGVDMEGNLQLQEIIKQIKLDKIILISSHILPGLMELSDAILLLEDGRFQKEYRPEEFESLQYLVRGDFSEQVHKALK